MVYKRKRNVRIDNSLKYPVRRLDSLDGLALEEYVPPALDTGMEADEEKELHLRKIIERGAGDIPIPVITEVLNPARELYGRYTYRNRYVRWVEDAGNEYLLDAEDRKFCRDSGIGEEEFSRSMSMISNEHSLEKGTEKKLVDVVIPKMLIRDERFNFPSYVCFRRRVIKPSRRSRRSEELSREKIERMWTEFYLLDTLCELSLQRNRLEQSLEEVELELFNSAYVMMKSSGRKYRKRMSRRLLMIPSEDRKARAVGPCGNINDLIFDRVRIRGLKKKLQENKQKRSLSEKEAEIQALKRYNEAHGL